MSNAKNANTLFLALVLVSIGASLILGLINIEIPMTWNLIISQLLMLVPTIIYLLLTKTKPTQIIPFKKIRISTVFMVILFTCLAMPFMWFINSISQLFVSNATTAITENVLDNPFWFNILLIGIMPALSEELICRGVFFGSYRKSGVIRGALLTGAVFGMIHMNLNQFSYAFALGILFCFLMEATGTIFAPMIGHFIINSSSVVLLEFEKYVSSLMGDTQSAQKLLEQAEEGMSRSDMLISVAVIFVLFLITAPLAVLVYIWISKHCGRFEYIKGLFFPKSAIQHRAARETYQPQRDYYGQLEGSGYNNKESDYNVGQGADYNNSQEAQMVQMNAQIPFVEPENILDNRQKNKIVSPALIAAVVISLGLMIWSEFL